MGVEFGNPEAVRCPWRMARTPALPGYLTGQKCGARRAADGAVGVPVGEANAFGRHSVEIGRAKVGCSHARQVAVALVVRHEDDDVRPSVVVWHRDLDVDPLFLAIARVSPCRAGGGETWFLAYGFPLPSETPAKPPEPPLFA